VARERAAVQAIAAGCDVALVCGTDHALHARVLEAIIYAAEQETLSPARLEDARRRQRRAKERFLAGSAPHPLSGAALERALGTPEHVAVAEAMTAWA